MSREAISSLPVCGRAPGESKAAKSLASKTLPEPLVLVVFLLDTEPSMAREYFSGIHEYLILSSFPSYFDCIAYLTFRMRARSTGTGNLVGGTMRKLRRRTGAFRPGTSELERVQGASLHWC